MDTLRVYFENLYFQHCQEHTIIELHTTDLISPQGWKYWWASGLLTESKLKVLQSNSGYPSGLKPEAIRYQGLLKTMNLKKTGPLIFNMKTKGFLAMIYLHADASLEKLSISEVKKQPTFTQSMLKRKILYSTISWSFLSKICTQRLSSVKYQTVLVLPVSAFCSFVSAATEANTKRPFPYPV